MKYIIPLLLFFFPVVAISQVQSETYFHDCGMVIVNDLETTPYLDTLLYHYNFDIEYLLSEYEFVNVLNEKDFTCVKSYEIIHGDGDPVISFNKPDFRCYDIGWGKASVVYVGNVDDSCGVNITSLFLLPDVK